MNKMCLGIIDSYSIEKMGQNFHICFRSGLRWLTPLPFMVSLTVKYPLFFTPRLRKLGREASEARQSKPTDENQSLQMKWTKSFGSTTIRQSDEMNENDPRKIEDHKLPSIFLRSHNASPKPLLRANEMTILFERGPIYCFTTSLENCSELHLFRY